MPATCYFCGAAANNLRWILPAWTGPASPQSPVPECESCSGRGTDVLSETCLPDTTHG